MRVIKSNTNPAHEATRIAMPNAESQQCTYMASEEVRKIALPTMEGIQFEPVQQIISLEAKGS
jgi:hypothetical protein